VRVRGRTREVIRRLKIGRLPAATEARKSGTKEFAAILTFDEFRDVQPAPRPRRKVRRSTATGTRSKPAAAPPSPMRWRPILIGGAIFAVLALVLLVCWLFFST